MVTTFHAKFKPDVFIFDPLANMTESPETNDVFRRLGKRLSHLADECDSAIEVVHHTRKLGGRKADIEDRPGDIVVMDNRSSHKGPASGR